MTASLKHATLSLLCAVFVAAGCDGGPERGSSKNSAAVDSGMSIIDNGVGDSADAVGQDMSVDSGGQRDADSHDSDPPDARLNADMAIQTDVTAPSWPAGAALFAARVQQHDVELAWSHAIDDTAVSLYRLFQDGREIGQVPGHRSSFLVRDLLEGATYNFGVLAEDDAGNRSTTLSLTLMTNDQAAPTWAEDAVLRTVVVGETAVTLSWPAARDNVAVTRYRVLLDGRIVGETSVGTFELSNLSALTTYRAEVVAIDGTGNTSAVNPSLTFTTIDTSAPSFAAGATVVLHDATPRQARVTWQAALDNVAVAGYEVALDGAQQGRVDAATRTYTLQGLQAGTRVTVSVRAFDASGNMSAAGPNVTFDTGDDTAPTWPANASLVASDLAPDSLTLGWTAALDDVGVNDYIITQNGQVLGLSVVAQFAVGELTPWTDYSFTVRARDALGNASVDVLRVDVRTPDRVVPSWQLGDALTAVDVTPTELTLSWPSAADDVTVVSYEVAQDGAVVGTVDGATTTFDVSGLTPWTEYMFAVVAIDQAGNRSAVPLSVRQRTTDTVLPTWPDASLSVDEVASSSLRLAWTAGSDDVGIAAYVVEQDGIMLARLAGDVLTLAVNGLEPWTEYTFTVHAEDAAGNVSAQALSVVQRTLDTVAPSFPDDAVLTIVDLTSTSAIVRWPTAVDDVGILRYDVALDGLAQAPVDGQVTEIQLSQLRAVRTYLVTVTAIDAAGNLSAELRANVITPEGGPPTWGTSQLTGTAGISEVQLNWGPAVTRRRPIAFSR